MLLEDWRGDLNRSKELFVCRPCGLTLYKHPLCHNGQSEPPAPVPSKSLLFLQAVARLLANTDEYRPRDGLTAGYCTACMHGRSGPIPASWRVLQPRVSAAASLTPIVVHGVLRTVLRCVENHQKGARDSERTPPNHSGVSWAAGSLRSPPNPSQASDEGCSTPCNYDDCTDSNDVATRICGLSLAWAPGTCEHPREAVLVSPEHAQSQRAVSAGSAPEAPWKHGLRTPRNPLEGGGRRDPMWRSLIAQSCSALSRINSSQHLHLG